MNKFTAVLAILLTAVFSTNLLFAEQNISTNVEFILDASNSMNESAGGEAKISAAKRVLINLIEAWTVESSGNLNIGLRVYGANFDPTKSRQVACRDTKIEVPINGINISAIRSKVMSVEAKGYTPIAYSLEQNLNDFKGMEGQNNVVILVSDGKESCDGDPCAVARRLAEHGIKLKVNVVGFDVTEDEKKQLECIAEATGGKYFTAKNANDLKIAAEEAKKAVVEEQKKIEVTTKRIKLKSGSITTKPSAGVEKPKYWCVYDATTSEQKSKMDDWGTANLKEGSYNITVQPEGYNAMEAKINAEPVLVKNGEETIFELNTGISILAANWTEKPEYVIYRNADTGEVIQKVYDDWKTTLLPPGNIKISLLPKGYDPKEVDMLPNGVIQLKKGEIISFKVSTGITFSAEKWAPIPEWIYILNAQTNDIVQKVNNAWKSVILPPGSYKVSIEDNEYNAIPADVTPAGKIDLNEGECPKINFSSGISPNVAPWVKPPKYMMIRRSGDGTLIAQIYQKYRPQLLAPGKYKVSVIPEGYYSVEMDMFPGEDIEVKADEKTEIELNSGIKFIVPENREKPEYISFYDASTGTLIQKTNDEWGTHLLPPGVYKITTKSKGYNAAESELGTGIEVNKGELVELEL